MTQPPPEEPEPSEQPDVRNYDVHPNYTGPLRIPRQHPESAAAREYEWQAEVGVDPVPDAALPDPTVSGALPVAGEHPSGPLRPFEPHDEGPWSGAFAAPPPVIPRQRAPRPAPSIPLRPIVIGVVTVILIGGIVALLAWFSGGADDTAGTPAPTPTTPAMSEDDARATLKGMLPAGYPPAACEPVATPKGALAKFGCEGNADAGGPVLATYTLVADAQALQKAFEDVIANSNVVNCPGAIQSPGPWRRNATPDKVAGTLFCGYQRDLPTLAWTNNEDLVVAAVRGDAQGPNLDALYRWWSLHS